MAEDPKWRNGVKRNEANQKAWNAFCVSHTKAVPRATKKRLGSHDSMHARMVECVCLEGGRIKR